MKTPFLKKIFNYFFAALIIVLFIYLVINLFDKIETTFNVTATTEIVQCHSIEKPISRVNLFDAALFTLKSDESLNFIEDTLNMHFNGTLEISDSTHIKLERISWGPLQIEIERPGGGTVAILRNNETQSKVEVTDILFIEINNIDSLLQKNISIVFPLYGNIKIGKSIDMESNNEYSLVLREGEITMTGSTHFTKHHFAAGREQLFLGDRLVFDDNNAFGFVMVSDEPAIQVSYRAVGNEARIIKPGPRNLESGYKFSASLYSRFKYDNFFQSISILFGIVLTVVSMLDFLINYYGFRKEHKRK